MADIVITGTDKNIIDFLAAVPKHASKDMELIMYDTEPTPFGTIGDSIAFDIGFKTFKPMGSSRGQIRGGLVYEVLRNREIMGHLMNQKKLSDATADEYYYVTKMLSEEGWFSNKIDEIPNYGGRTKKYFLNRIYEHLRELNNSAQPSSVQIVNEVNQKEMYLSIINHLKVNRESVEFFERQEEQNMTTKQREKKAQRRAKTMKTLLDVYAEFINQTTTNRDALRQLQYENSKMHADVQKIRDGYFKTMIIEGQLGKNLNYESDLKLLKDLAKQNVSGANDVKPINKIMKEYKDLYKSKNVVGIMGHNISSDLRWTRNTLKHIQGADRSYIDDFTEDKIDAYCSQQFADRLFSLQGTEIVDTLFGIGNGEIYNQFKKLAEEGRLPKLGQHGKGVSLQQIYSTIIDKDAVQPHSARGDIDWTIDVVQHYMKDIVKHLEGRR